MSLPTDLKVSIRSNVQLANYCTMQVGGQARYFAEPSNEEELLEALEFARQENLPFMILGKGSNVIFPDEGYPGLVIALIHFGHQDVQFHPEKPLVTAAAGVYLYRLVLACRNQGLAGAEFLASIPGTVGGAVMMNAGYSRFPGQRSEISDLIQEVTSYDYTGKKEVWGKDKLEFSYRHSNFKNRIVTSATLSLWHRSSEIIEKEIRACFTYRNSKQDMQHPSCGSVFKNPKAPALTAGRLIEKAGLKGKRVGDIQVSEKHGNYFVNLGNGKASEVIELIQIVQKAVFDATQISLEPEVQIIERP